METKTYKLKDICEIKSGKRLPLGCDFSAEPTAYPYIRARDIKKGKVYSDDLAYITKDVQSKIKKYIVDENDILITIVANIGDVGLVTRDLQGFNLTENAVRLTNFAGNVDSRFLCLYMSQPDFKKYLEGLAVGAAQAKLGIYKIEKIKIQLPPLPTQRRIASILSTYDALIQNYKRQIAALQSAASELYKEWFVRFRFPGYKSAKFTNSRIGRIPTTFDVKKQNEVITNHIGGGWGEDEQSENFPIEAAVVRGTDFPEFANGNISTCPIRYHKASNYNSRIIEPDDIILEVSGGTQEQPVGRTVIVSKDRLDRFNNKLICASFCKLIKLDKSVITPFFYYYWMQFVYDTRIITRYQLQSTGIINFKFEYFLRKGDVLIPTKELMESFDSKVRLIHTQIEKLAIAITNLTTQRDLLLPRLMSGKLSVE